MHAAYSVNAKRLHWLIALLIVAQFLVTLLMPDIKEGMTMEPVITLHFTLGLLVLLLMAVRLVVRLRNPVEAATTPGKPLERVLAVGVHRLFYAILLTSPFLGWIAASAHGLPVALFGIVELPALAADHAEWGHQAGDVHGLVMWTLLGLIALHAGAALFHHLVRRDDTLRRMLPDRSR